tara:strand:+ start:10565 stop:10906 length:342 start_codon:yes stop_codon:yes gene_type:complete
MSLIARFVEQLRRKVSEPEQRLSMRESDPWLFIDIGGVEFRARDWSAGGARLQACTADLAIGQIVSGSLRWHKRETGHNFTAEIMRLDLGGEVALRWLDLPDAVFAAMEPPEH